MPTNIARKKMKFARFAILAAFGMILTACSDESGFVTDAGTARSVLLDAGYTRIQIGGFSWFSGCGFYWFQTEFSAVGPTGRYVNGTVCSSIIGKGAQILIDSK